MATSKTEITTESEPNEPTQPPIEPSVPAQGETVDPNLGIIERLTRLEEQSKNAIGNLGTQVGEVKENQSALASAMESISNTMQSLASGVANTLSNVGQTASEATETVAETPEVVQEVVEDEAPTVKESWLARRMFGGR